jgi:hypothetical protein
MLVGRDDSAARAPTSMPAATAPRRVASATRCAAAGIAGAAEEGLRQRSGAGASFTVRMAPDRQ